MHAQELQDNESESFVRQLSWRQKENGKIIHLFLVIEILRNYKTGVLWEVTTNYVSSCGTYK